MPTISIDLKLAPSASDKKVETMRKITFTAVVCLLSAAFTLPALDFIDTNTHLRIVTLTNSTAPQIVLDHVLFSFKQDKPVRHVGIAFQHESFQTIRNLEINEFGVYVFVYEPPEGTEEIVYRYVVDGLWMTDPKNPDRTADKKGAVLSRIDTMGAFPIRLKSPTITNDRVQFFYSDLPGRRIYLTGDFANWDPFIYLLKESQPGIYSIALRMTPGLHLYNFVVGGDHITDPLNERAALSAEGRAVSVLSIATQ